MLNIILIVNKKINGKIFFESKLIINDEVITNIKSKFNSTFKLALVGFFCRITSIDLQSLHGTSLIYQ